MSGLAALLLLCANANANDWWDAAWTLRKKITVDTTAAGGNIAEPIDAGGCEGGVGIEAAGDGVVDDCLLLFIQQRDQPLLRADQPRRHAPMPIEKADDQPLLVERGERNTDGSEAIRVEPQETGLAGAQSLAFRSEDRCHHRGLEKA